MKQFNLVFQIVVTLAVMVNSIARAETLEVTAHSGLRFYDSKGNYLEALPHDSEVQSTGRHDGNWKEVVLPNGRHAWAWGSYLHAAVAADPDTDTEAQYCPKGDGSCHRRSSVDSLRNVARAAAPRQATHRASVPVQAAPNMRRGFRMVEDPWQPGRWYHHQGQDYPAPFGKAVTAVKDGVVIAVQKSCGDSYGNSSCGHGFGNTVTIRHADGHTSMYAHLSNSGRCPALSRVRVGEPVNAGQQIACVGASGRATGPHLMFLVRNGNGTEIDPLQYLRQIGAMR